MSMERDNEMIRDLLIQFKDKYNPGAQISPSSEKEDYHMYLLTEKGLIESDRKAFLGGEPPIYFKLRITSSGHDFLEVAENSTIWEKSKETLKEKGMQIGSVPIDVLKEYLKMQARKHMGIE
ncbi:DUF2513 domain-containing protein [Salipaludibacillus sp. CF4.18]|uniref:DUF2513 domain-containing protein n=1 Tax=Salipaludibacillus sp. CF4.18 TaxID=3373081 RepID=UPI003EE5C329